MTLETEEIVEHPCRYCEKEIPDWRRNKVFCDDTCKYKFHNAKRSMAEDSFGDYHRMIKRNYEILNNALGEKRYVEIPELHLKILDSGLTSVRLQWVRTAIVMICLID